MAPGDGFGIRQRMYVDPLYMAIVEDESEVAGNYGPLTVSSKRIARSSHGQPKTKIGTINSELGDLSPK